jgi:polyhydroxyalkanoate synthesis repressor PhaR
LRRRTNIDTGGKDFRMTTRRKRDERLIKRYGNRKLYDVAKSRYITLEGIRALVQQGEDVRVMDNDSGEDLTGVTFAQIIYEAQRRTAGALSLPLLRRLVQVGDETVQRGREALENMREAAEQGVHRLVENAADEGRKLLDELLDAPQRRFDDLQRRIDTQVRKSVERVTQNPTLRHELKRVENNLRQLEKKLAHLTHPDSRPPSGATKRKAKREKRTQRSSKST